VLELSINGKKYQVKVNFKSEKNDLLITRDGRTDAMPKKRKEEVSDCRNSFSWIKYFNSNIKRVKQSLTTFSF
jgi:hypothetical protein